VSQAPPMPLLREAIRTSLLFDSFVNLVPPKLYMKPTDIGEVGEAAAVSGKGSKKTRLGTSLMLTTCNCILEASMSGKRGRRREEKTGRKRDREEGHIGASTSSENGPRKKGKAAARERLHDGRKEKDTKVEEEQEESATRPLGETADGHISGASIKDIPSLPREVLRARLQQKLASLRKDKADKTAGKAHRKSRPRTTGGGASSSGPSINKRAPRHKAPVVTDTSVAEGPAVDDQEGFQFAKFVAPKSNNILLANKPGSRMRRLASTIKELESQNAALQAMSPKEREVAEQQIAMARAMQKAEGQKVKTDLQRLKKTMKHREKRKEASRIQWQERKEQLTESKVARHQRREENLKTKRSRHKLQPSSVNDL